MICMNTYVITRVMYVYPLHYWHGHVMPYILNAWRAWPMTWPLHIIMPMHELLIKLKKSVHWSMPMSLMPPRYEQWQHGRRGRLYATKVKWKFYPTSCALLDVGFMFILKRTDIFIIIWACTAVLPNVTTVIFQIIQALKQNYCVV